jgi:hypothetical protein
MLCTANERQFDLKSATRSTDAGRALEALDSTIANKNRRNKMTQFPRSLSQAFGMAAVAAILIFVTSPARAQTKNQAVTAAATTLSIPVSVTNPSLTVQGNVNANVSGTVGVNSLPAVQLAGTPAVQLNNTPATPVYVDAERAARNGFNVSCFTGNIDPVYGQASCSLLTIPAGRQVVIETVSCQAELATGDGPADVQLIVPNTPFSPGGPDHVSHLLALSKQDSSSSVDIWRLTTPLRAYGSAPAQGSVDVGLFFRANPAASGPQGISCTISGFLVSQ